MQTAEPAHIGTHLEPFVDEFLIERLDGARLQLHHPTPREVVLTTDRPCEGKFCGYITVFEDAGRFRMYYKAEDAHLRDGKFIQAHPIMIAYAESTDGIRWERPELGLVEFNASRKNNLVFAGDGPEQLGVHGFAPFKDLNPACSPDARYKAVGAPAAQTAGRLYAFKSPDGLHWSLIQPNPIITKSAFDSQNLAFWDSASGIYRAYMRDWHDLWGGGRDIRTATSTDFIHWSDPEWLQYPGAPFEQLYTNQIIPYYRAPHILLGFPTRYVERPWCEAIENLPELEHRRLRSSISERYGTALTDGLFMSSRDGRTFRRWGEAFLRPGPAPIGNWAYGDNYQCWGLLETDSGLPGNPREISFYSTENYWRQGGVRIRRFTLRLDGFVSIQAPLSGGSVLTRPLLFDGRHLRVNFATSAAGSIRIEVLAADATVALPGLSLDDSVPLIGDDVCRCARWRSGADLSRASGQPVRLRFALQDADLYSIRFSETPA